MPHPLSIAFIWHMHQPYYRDLATGECPMPWVRLHAAKDYVDMVARLEAFPAIHQTVNVVPSLLDQIDEYLPPASRSDAFLDLSRTPAAALTDAERRFVLQWFFLANRERMIDPYPRYRDLWVKRGAEVAEAEWSRVLPQFREQDYLDLQVWFNLTWIDPWLRRQDPQLARLETKGAYFTEDDKQVVLDAQLGLLARIVPTYRRAAEQGRVELSTSPAYHPILPLLCDLRAARAAMPDVRLPERAFQHPEDARAQIRDGLARHAQAFGRPAAGMWPPEGSVSEQAAALAIEAGIAWIATDEEILWRTLRSPRTPATLYRPHRLQRPQGELAILFRDRELSDLIGFVYSRWGARQAAEDFLRRLGQIHEQLRDAPEPPLVTIILDGENAWESYPDDGHEFLTALYGALAADARFRCVTVSEFLGGIRLDRAPSLPALHSGSWIGGDFSTWIGHPEKNAAWELLAAAREALEPLRAEGRLPPAAWRSVCAAEGSDWMWWFGDTHYSAQADEFDRLFRAHVANSYRLAGLPAPEATSRPIRRPGQGSSSPPMDWIHPVIDGRDTSYYEWLFAGHVSLAHYGALHRGDQALYRLSYGSDGTSGFLKVDVELGALARLAAWGIELRLGHARVRVRPGPAGAVAQLEEAAAPQHVACALGRALELAVPLAALGTAPDEPLRVVVTVLDGEQTIERHPADGEMALTLAPADAASHGW